MDPGSLSSPDYRGRDPAASVRVGKKRREGTGPWALRSFLEADSSEEIIRNAISLGGDAGTLACIAGAVAGPYSEVRSAITAEVLGRLDDRLRTVVAQFAERFGGRGSGCGEPSVTLDRAGIPGS